MNTCLRGGCAASRVFMSLLLCAGILVGCGGMQIDAPPPKQEAERLYFDGVEYLREGAFLEAQQTFVEALKKPGYLEVTSLSRLRLGDALYFQQKFQRAVEQYEAYARRHDGSANIPYARFMVAKSYYKLIPTDFWLLPPVYEMDLSAADKARYHLEAFIHRYPLSRYATEAAFLRDKCIDLQLSHHEYVVRFYIERRKWLGAVFRLHEVMRRFPIRGHTLANYKLLSRAYATLKWRRRTVELNRAIAQRWQGEAAADRARSTVAAARSEIARLKAAGDPAAEMPVESPPTSRYRPEALPTGS